MDGRFWGGNIFNTIVILKVEYHCQSERFSSFVRVGKIIKEKKVVFIKKNRLHEEVPDC
ncbi:hypothetical protein [Sutcliffiella rhizosphaerae]|uniref:hypothetical protein n=1 Tax=Sutcliffiella rhizosphaerae TaxID=2880967 RepID=UPI001E42C443|nr:hypothetical protein [Sutcliffiella rhizosphaerae]